MGDAQTVAPVALAPPVNAVGADHRGADADQQPQLPFMAHGEGAQDQAIKQKHFERIGRRHANICQRQAREQLDQPSGQRRQSLDGPQQQRRQVRQAHCAKADRQTERHNQETDQRNDQRIGDEAGQRQMAKVMSDQRPGAERCQQRHGQVQRRLAGYFLEPAFFLRQVIGSRAAKALLHAPAAPDDEQHREKR